MKVLLVNPGRENTSKNLDVRSSAPPLGLLYVASSLENAGHEVKLIDQLGTSISDSQLVGKIKSFDADLVGFGAMGIQTESAGRISDKIKKEMPNVKTLCGGINPTFNAERILSNYPNIDYCIKGEGELSTIELLNAFRTNKFDEVHGLVYKKGRSIKHGLPRQLIKDLDALPFPNRKLLGDVEYGDLSGMRVKGFTTVLSSRGCPFSCKYCCCNALTNRTVRYRSIKNILDELEIVRNQGYKMFLFSDDSLTLNNNRVVELCKGMKERGIKLDWFFEGRADNVDFDTMKWAVKSGAKVAYFGAESANQRILDYYDKKTTPGKVRKAIDITRKAGMDFIVASFILGAPTETKKEIDNTINFMTSLDVDFVQVTNLIAYPGTMMWNDFVSNGYIDAKKYWETGIGVGKVHPESLPDDYLQAKVKEAYSRFVTNPRVRTKHILRLIKSSFRRNVFFQNVRYFDKNLVKKLIGR